MKFIEALLNSSLRKWEAMLLKGDLGAFEMDLDQSIRQVYNKVCEELVSLSSVQVIENLILQAKAKGGRKIQLRPYSLRIATGHQIALQSPYVKKPGKDWVGPRNLLAKHWHTLGGASPALYDKVGFCSALCPSYNLAHQSLSKFGTNICLSSVRDLTNRLANHCYEHGEENLQLESAESLAGKRVVISMDGGRTRTRNYEGQDLQVNWPDYQTAWCEPKLFVIDVLNQAGQPDRYELPIYGCRFSETAVLELLERYLGRLQIHQAKEVQILADGAPWIWNHIKPLLLKLKVNPNRIVQTLDYYHASKYIYELVHQMPSRISQQQRQVYLKQFKDWLWQGLTHQIVQCCRSIYKRPGKLVKRWINYLDKHQDKTQYAAYQQNKLMCGSGIIESAIRRIINLRFKNASTLWEKHIVEKLYFLRAALLAKRWETLMTNIAKST